MTPLEFEL